jgi:hypothetical protein
MRLVLPKYPSESWEFADWLARKHGEEKWPRDADEIYGYGLKTGDNVMVACVLQSFHAKGSFLSSMFADGPAVMRHRHLCEEAIRIPFTEMFNARRVSLILKETDERTIKVAELFGFEKEGLLRDHFGTCHGVLLGLTKDRTRTVSICA